MSPNTPPNQPGDASDIGNVSAQASHAGGADPLDANNPYSARYHEASTPDLDANAPELRSADMRRMNRRALLFLIAIVVLVIIVGIWAMKIATNRNDKAPKQRDETVTVPDAPKSMPRPPSEQPRSNAIQLAPSLPPMPDPRQMPMPMQDDPRVPSLLERRMMAGDAPANGQTRNSQPTQAPQANEVDATSAQPLNHPDTLMLRGTYIRCVLETRIITDIPGFTSCVVTEPVYSFNGRKLLLPKGSKVLGKYDMEPTTDRVAVIWDRIVTPNGIDVNMASPGIDNLGGAGHPGYYNAHWGSRIGAALLVSMLSDAFKYEAAEHGPSQTTVSNGVVTQTPFESNTATTLQNLANQAVQRSANRPATVTINQGTVVTIYVAKDVDFSGVVARF